MNCKCNCDFIGPKLFNTLNSEILVKGQASHMGGKNLYYYNAKLNLKIGNKNTIPSCL